MRRPGLLAGLALALLGSPALAQVEVISARPESVAVVAYRDRPIDTAELYGADDQPFYLGNSGLALITETRTVDVPAGRSRIRFRGVAEGMLPQSAELSGLPGGIERNYDFDLLSPGTLIQRAVGERVRRVRTNRETGAVTEEAALLRSGPDGVVLDIAGRIEALGCSGGPERLVFDRVPPGLADTPTLSVLVDSARAGRRTLTLSYLAFGVQWAADYVAHVRPDGRTLDLIGWITLSNRTRTTFAHAPLQVVAGEVSRVPAEAPQANLPERRPNCWPMDTTKDIASELAEEIVVTGGRVRAMAREELAFAPPLPPPPAVEAPAPAMIAEQTELGDYKLYTLPERVTIGARQTKQVAFLNQRGVPFERVFTHWVTGERGVEAATVSYRLENTEAAGLGRPLPTGTVSVIAPATNGRMALVGQARPRDLPVGEQVRLDVGRSNDVRVLTRMDAAASPIVVEAEISNAGAEPAEVEIVHPSAGQAVRVVKEDRPHIIRDGQPVWRAAVPANGRETVRYTVQLGAAS